MHDDDGGVGGRERFEAEAPFGEPARAEVLDDEVAAGRDPRHEGPALFRAEVDGERALAPGDRGPPQAVAVAGHPPPSHRVALARRLDLDHLGAVVGQQLAGEGPGDEAAELEHAHAGQGTWARWTGAVSGHRPIVGVRAAPHRPTASAIGKNPVMETDEAFERRLAALVGRAVGAAGHAVAPDPSTSR